MGHTVFEGWLDNRFVNRIVHKAVFGVAMLFCIGWSALAAVESGASVPASVSARELTQQCARRHAVEFEQTLGKRPPPHAPNEWPKACEGGAATRATT